MTTASIRLSTWHQAEPLLESWKSLLQSLPGYTHGGVLLRPLENGDVRCMISVTWEFREQLEEFLACRWATEAVINTLNPKPYDVQTEILEDVLEFEMPARQTATAALSPGLGEPYRYAEDERRASTAAEDARWRTRGRDWVVLASMMAVSLAYHLTIFALQPGLR